MLLLKELKVNIMIRIVAKKEAKEKNVPIAVSYNQKFWKSQIILRLILFELIILLFLIHTKNDLVVLFSETILLSFHLCLFFQPARLERALRYSVFTWPKYFSCICSDHIPAFAL